VFPQTSFIHSDLFYYYFVFQVGCSSQCSDFFSSSKDAQNQVVARRSFFRCSTVQLHWSKGSTGLLVLAQADVDKTNQSYYGETMLNYLTTDRAFEGIVPLSKYLGFDETVPFVSSC
jgi:hypothetical protein